MVTFCSMGAARIVGAASERPSLETSLVTSGLLGLLKVAVVVAAVLLVGASERSSLSSSERAGLLGSPESLSKRTQDVDRRWPLVKDTSGLLVLFAVAMAVGAARLVGAL
ncbi:hypothetical protein DPMN_016388 [Dreissena polymorpha]|uniref:Uncharacterized protein n=1 Tax=Dreissena polymorpha TaxID=45954 RepID=A0A9D4S6I3_DREPO|nr:hypothetical protein DPMN_016388 [Dreissena polymorpha]